MIVYRAKVNEIITCIYGTYYITEGKDYPEFLYNKFPRFFDIVEVKEEYQPQLPIYTTKLEDKEKRRTNK